MRIITGPEKQKTVATEASFKGIGLHTGSKCTLTFKPAPADHGVTFIRTDLPGKPVLHADSAHVTSVIRGTTLSEGGDKDAAAKVHTVEHVLSALAGLGLDNMVIELDANEPPVADGSSYPFIETLRKAGLRELDAPRRFFQPDRMEYVGGETGTLYLVEPSDDYSVDVTIDFPHPLIGRQSLVSAVTPETYVADFSRARTFCFDFEVEALKRQGLAKGGSLDNAVVVGADRIHNREKVLRFPDEFVRHKAMDLVGDLFLLGMPLKAKITAVRVGHGYNVNLVKKIAEQLEACRASTPV
jgi:UDP-3-O-[3-hydroxymyristoyl] N-acetylglucosamine deacetylase/3-hydroxyacyl-[acyl-carrier-protein] dehydratase